MAVSFDEEFWRVTFRLFEISGLSVSEFCRERKIPRRTFQRWRSKLQTTNTATRLSVTPSFVEVSLPQTSVVPEYAFELQLENDTYLRFREDVSVSAVQRIVAGLKEQRC